MDLINDICCDISFLPDRLVVLRKYMMPLILERENFEGISRDLINDLFSILNKSEVEILKVAIEEIIEQEITCCQDFLDTEWKVGECENCGELRCLTKCKHDHDEECEYSEVTKEEGCNKKFCDECVFHTCQEPCTAIRCKSCCENI